MAQASIALTGGSQQSFFAETSRGSTPSVRSCIGPSFGWHGSLSTSKAHSVFPFAEGSLGSEKSVKYYSRHIRKCLCARSVWPMSRAGMPVKPRAAHLKGSSGLKLVPRFPAWVSEAVGKERLSKVGFTHLFGINAFTLLLSATPAQAAKFIPPPLGTSDALPVTDEVTPADLGGLATVGLILLLVFVVGNVVLPSLMFSDGEPTSPYKRDEEGDFYQDPSFTKKFFKEARASDEDIDEVAWSKAPFSKLAHGLSKIFPPPNSIGTPPELAKVRSKGLQRPPGPVGSGVKFSGIVAAPGYGSAGPERQLGGDQAASTGSNEPGPSVVSNGEGLLARHEDVTLVEASSNSRGSTGAVKEAALEKGRTFYRHDVMATDRRIRKRMTGFGRSNASRQVGSRPPS